MRHRSWLAVSGLLVASVSHAQVGRSHVGAAVGTIQYERLSSAGLAAVGVRELMVSRPFAVRGDVRLLRHRASGSPQTCALVERTFCSGREDRLSAASAGVALVLDGQPRSANAFYLVPIQLGVSHLRASSSEWQAPTLLCVGNGQVTSCPEPSVRATRSALERHGRDDRDGSRASGSGQAAVRARRSPSCTDRWAESRVWNGRRRFARSVCRQLR